MKLQRSSSPVPALLVVGLGMLLVTSLATLAVWIVYRRRAAGPSHFDHLDEVPLAGGPETAEAK